MTIKLKQNQTLFDIALIHFGNANAAFAIAEHNNISITDILLVGREIKLPETIENVNKPNVDFYRKNDIEPATGDTRLFSKKLTFIGYATKFLKLINGKQLYLIGWSIKIPITPFNRKFAKFTFISGLQLYFINQNKDTGETITPIRNIYTNYTIIKGQTLKLI
jgi:hypothetical protein